MSIPISVTNPETDTHAPHTVVITVTYDGPVTDETLQGWRDVLAMYQHNSCSVNFGTTMREKGKRPSDAQTQPCQKHFNKA